ncbi:hypothetical protein DTO012A8_7972 [Penicillium roqueforti]|nr:hypothetical protein DTO012A8_7972 [Penicillium roqueforti]
MVSFKMFRRKASTNVDFRSPEEKALVRRLDMFLMTFGCLSQVIKYLDQQNINNAYVSGMKEDLNLLGNELNLFTTYFNVAYCIMLIPSQVILTYVRPSYWLPGLEIAWGVLTGLVAMTTSAKQVYIIRVFLGLCESSAWPGMMTLFNGSARWTVSQVNAIPIGGSAINVVFVWIWALLSDYFETRWALIVIQAVIGIVPCIIMSIWTTHPLSVGLSAVYASYFISYICLGTAPLIFAWLSDLIPQDPEARSLVVGVAVAGYYAISSWSQVLVWPASQAPFYKYGWQSALALLVLVIIMTSILRFVDVRYLLPKREEFRAVLEEDIVVGKGVSTSVSPDQIEGRHRRDESPKVATSNVHEV